MGKKAFKVWFVLLLIVLPVFLYGLWYGGWTLYENHVSSAVRNTVINALEPEISNDNLQALLQAAQEQTHTPAERELVGRLKEVAVLYQEREEKEEILRKAYKQKADLENLNHGPCADLLQASRNAPPLNSIVDAENFRNTLVAMRSACLDNSQKEDLDTTITENQGVVYDYNQQIDNKRNYIRDSLGLPRAWPDYNKK